MDRAYALLDVKSVDAERRTFSGIASTPELDRQGDIVDPAGVTLPQPAARCCSITTSSNPSALSR